jgi:formyltetrahydrofolate synthetase
VETHGHASILKEQYAAVQNVLFILLADKHNNVNKLPTSSMLMSALCKVFTIGAHKGVAFSKNIMQQCEGKSSENNIYESTRSHSHKCVITSIAFLPHSIYVFSYLNMASALQQPPENIMTSSDHRFCKSLRASRVT